MKAKIAIILLLLSFTLTKSVAADTLRFELLKLEEINVDTFIRLDINSYVGCVNVRFRQGKDTIVYFSFINTMAYINPNVTYYWTKQTTRANFTLTKGMHYKLLLLPLCKKELDKDCFYVKYATFNDDNCSLSKVFNMDTYLYIGGEYNPKLYHYGHIDGKIYEVCRFYPTFGNEIKNSGYKLDFIPIKLGKNKY